MAGVVDQSLEARLLELEATVRALRARNPLESAAVVDPATGDYVALSSLAFGQVVEALDTNPGGPVTLTGPLNVDNDDLAPAWTYGEPHLDVLVTGGRVRTDWGGRLVVDGLEAQALLSYRLIYLGPPEAKGSASVEIVPANYNLSVIAHSPDGDTVIGAYGLFTFWHSLTPGWYRMQAAYGLIHTASPTIVPRARFYWPRIGATPY